MKHLLIILSFICLICSCSTLNDVSQAPSWVQSIRSGDGKLQISVGDKYYFRANYRSTKTATKEEICELALKKSKDFIKSHYQNTNLNSIPMTYETEYFDSVVNDCSYTISVPKSFKAIKSKETDFIGIKSAEAGTLDLKIFPNENLDILIDDILQNYHSSVKIGLVSGKHTIEIQHPQYKNFKKTIHIKEQETTGILIDLVPVIKKAVLDIKDEMGIPLKKDLKVFVNNKVIDKNSFIINLTSDYEVRIEHPEMNNLKFKIYAGEFETTNQDEIIISRKMKQKNSLLTLLSTPKGAKVYKNNVFVGKTPLTNVKVNRGKQTYEIRKEGYAAKVINLYIRGGENTSQTITLDKNDITTKKNNWHYPNSTRSIVGYVLNVVVFPVRIVHDFSKAFAGYEEFENLQSKLEPADGYIGYYLENLIFYMPGKLIVDTLGTAFGKSNYDFLNGV